MCRPIAPDLQAVASLPQVMLQGGFQRSTVQLLDTVLEHTPSASSTSLEISHALEAAFKELTACGFENEVQQLRAKAQAHGALSG